MVKRLLPILISALVLIQVLGWALSSSLSLVLHQHHEHEEEELMVLEFADRQQMEVLEWMHAKEFRFEGEMYDLVFIQENQDGRIQLLVEKDKKEDRLRKALKEAEEAERDMGGWAQLLLLAPPESGMEIWLVGGQKTSWPVIQKAPKGLHLTNLSPPPELGRMHIVG